MIVLSQVAVTVKVVPVGTVPTTVLLMVSVLFGTATPLGTCAPVADAPTKPTAPIRTAEPKTTPNPRFTAASIASCGQDANAETVPAFCCTGVPLALTPVVGTARWARRVADAGGTTATFHHGPNGSVSLGPKEPERGAIVVAFRDFAERVISRFPDAPGPTVLHRLLQHTPNVHGARPARPLISALRSPTDAQRPSATGSTRDVAAGSGDVGS